LKKYILYIYNSLKEALASQNWGGVRGHRAWNHYFDKNFAYFFSTEKVRDKITKLQHNLLITSRLKWLGDLRNIRKF